MRRETYITISDRGNELNFKIREMSAMQLERWIMKAFLALAGSGIDVPKEAGLEQAGEFLAKAGISAIGGLDFDKAEPLLDELLSCCSIIIGKMEKRLTPEIVDDHIQDVRTLLRLRMEALKLNFAFFSQGDAGSSGSPASRPSVPQAGT